eukprot:CAMPEP_0171086504 /NCGR_PEP_ID=MMETSP0766_2-20121228/19582_1 /TAXON_ID=439317 /ORGANISM="Gambierdiscus australes, Strain CAWD 149" /LENGTH=51 /DNA_ID=CAMNT_0011544155 /DNA_START=138 /DNA_END=293 /DNA_ORIENTATION=-
MPPRAPLRADWGGHVNEIMPDPAHVQREALVHASLPVESLECTSADFLRLR